MSDGNYCGCCVHWGMDDDEITRCDINPKYERKRKWDEEACYLFTDKPKAEDFKPIDGERIETCLRRFIAHVTSVVRDQQKRIDQLEKALQSRNRDGGRDNALAGINPASRT